jgi:hypothetical protein
MGQAERRGQGWGRAPLAGRLVGEPSGQGGTVKNRDNLLGWGVRRARPGRRPTRLIAGLRFGARRSKRRLPLVPPDAAAMGGDQHRGRQDPPIQRETALGGGRAVPGRHEAGREAPGKPLGHWPHIAAAADARVGPQSQPAQATTDVQWGKLLARDGSVKEGSASMQSSHDAPQWVKNLLSYAHKERCPRDDPGASIQGGFTSGRRRGQRPPSGREGRNTGGRAAVFSDYTLISAAKPFHRQIPDAARQSSVEALRRPDSFRTQGGVMRLRPWANM